MARVTKAELRKMFNKEFRKQRESLAASGRCKSDSQIDFLARKNAYVEIGNWLRNP